MDEVGADLGPQHRPDPPPPDQPAHQRDVGEPQQPAPIADADIDARLARHPAAGVEQLHPPRHDQRLQREQGEADRQRQRRAPGPGSPPALPRRRGPAAWAVSAIVPVLRKLKTIEQAHHELGAELDPGLRLRLRRAGRSPTDRRGRTKRWRRWSASRAGRSPRSRGAGRALAGRRSRPQPGGEQGRDAARCRRQRLPSRKFSSSACWLLSWFHRPSVTLGAPSSSADQVERQAAAEAGSRTTGSPRRAARGDSACGERVIERRALGRIAGLAGHRRDPREAAALLDRRRAVEHFDSPGARIWATTPLDLAVGRVAEHEPEVERRRWRWWE